MPDEKLIACRYWEDARESALIRAVRPRSLESRRSDAPRGEALHQDLQRVQMAQLERMQRMRRGAAVPAPLTVEFSDRG